MENSKTEIWQEILKELSDSLINEGLDIWFYSIKKAFLDEKTLTIEVPNTFYIEQIQKKEEEIKNIVKSKIGIEPQINYALSQEQHYINIARENSHQPTKQTSFVTNLNQEYTFENMVISKFNKFAATVSQNIANGNIKSPIPILFIYSKPGLGKTHMLHAIGNEMLRLNPRKKVIYITAEDFINDYINSLKQNTIETFRSKYRGLDCLLIDDIQFIVAKGRSEEEFFFTFNTLFEYKKTIVITSDRSPNDIELNPRLVSRLKSGIVADIQPPEFEERVAILERENEKNNCGIEKDIIDFLARNIKDNIRSLKGSLMKVYNYSIYTNEYPTIDKVKIWVSDYLTNDDSREKKITIDDIQKVVAEEYGITIEDLRSKQRKERLVFPRHIAIYLAHELTDLSWTDIGNAFNKDHSTTIHACEKIKSMVSTDPYFAETINRIINKIKTMKDIK